MQQINLYQDEFHVRYDRRIAGAMAALAIILVLFVVVTVVQIHSAAQLKNELTTTTKTIASLDVTYKALEKSAKPKAVDLRLVADLASVKRNNAEKLRALNYLSGNDSGNMIGFSYLMQGLGRKRDTINDLWLKTIKFDRGGYDMRVSGSSYQADLLPKFVKALGDEEIYKDREFREIKITRTDEKKLVVDFVLNTRQSGDSEETASSNKSLAMFIARLKSLSESHESEQ